MSVATRPTPAAPQTALSRPAQNAGSLPGNARTMNPHNESSSVGLASSPRCQVKLLAGNPGKAPRLKVVQ